MRDGAFMTPNGLREATAGLVDAAREIRRVRDAQNQYTRQLQELATETRRTGESQAHRIPPRVYDYGDAVASLLEALESYERAALRTHQEAAAPVGQSARSVAEEFAAREPYNTKANYIAALTAAIESDRASLASRLAEAEGLLREEANSWTCVEASAGANPGESFCIDLTDPDGKPTCWYCRARAFLGPSPTTGGRDGG